MVFKNMMISYADLFFLVSIAVLFAVFLYGFFYYRHQQGDKDQTPQVLIMDANKIAIMVSALGMTVMVSIFVGTLYLIHLRSSKSIKN